MQIGYIMLKKICIYIFNISFRIINNAFLIIISHIFINIEQYNENKVNYQ